MTEQEIKRFLQDLIDIAFIEVCRKPWTFSPRMKATERSVFSKEKPRAISPRSFIVPGDVVVQTVGKDPDDDKFLAAAIEGRADYIVSGDKPLLNIKEYHGIKIISPTAFIKIF